MTDILEDRRMAASVDAALSFPAPTEGRAYFYTYSPPPGVAPSNGEREQHTVTIGNGWHLPDDSLDTYGFQAGTRLTRFDSWGLVEAIRHDYYPEVEQHVLDVTGGTCAVVFDHNVRSSSTTDAQTWANTTSFARTANWVHNDYTPTSAPNRATEILGRKPSGRFAFINLWRPIVEPLRDTPLAVCDGRSVRESDLETTTLIYPGREGEYYLLRHHHRQAWCYFPEMTRSEALFLKCMDSAPPLGATRFSMHSAFKDPTTPLGSPPRQSIEARALVVWE